LGKIGLHIGFNKSQFYITINKGRIEDNIWRNLTTELEKKEWQIENIWCGRYYLLSELPSNQEHTPILKSWLETAITELAEHKDLLLN
jgi:hypothetical protein